MAETGKRDKKSSMMELDDNENFCGAILDHLHDAIIATQMNGHMLYFNAAAKKLFGFPDEIVKEEWLNYFDLANPNTKVKIEPNDHPVFRANREGNISEEEFILCPKKMASRYVKVTTEVINIKGLRDLIILQFQDITLTKEKEQIIIRKSKSLKEGYESLRRIEVSLKNTNSELEKRVMERTRHLTRSNLELQNQIVTRMQGEEKLKETNEELVKINNDLDNFVYVASHDLKTPIANIEGLIYALKDSNENDKEESAVFIKLIEHSLHKLKITINNLSDINKIQKSEDNLSEMLSFESVYAEIHHILLDIILNSNARIETDFSTCSELFFSKKNLVVVLYHLLNNSLKYRSPDRTPVIYIKTEKINGICVLTVSDNGIGFSESKKGKMFSMFTRLHDHVEGSGIGLYLVQRIVQNAKGKIEVDSVLNEGTTFKVSLPLIEN